MNTNFIELYVNKTEDILMTMIRLKNKAESELDLAKMEIERLNKELEKYTEQPDENNS